VEDDSELHEMKSLPSLLLGNKCVTIRNIARIMLCGGAEMREQP